MNFVRFFKKYGSVDIAFSGLLPGTRAGNAIFLNEYPLERRDYPQQFNARLSALLRGRPYPIPTYGKNSVKLLLSIIESNDYDHVLVRYIDQAYCLFNLPIRRKKRIIVDFDDILSGSVYDTYFTKTKSLYKRMIRYINRKLLIRYEKKCLNFGVSLFCSEEDSRRVIGNGNHKMVVPNIYSNKTFENYDFENGFENGNILLFVGALFYSPNVEGLKWFIESIFPGFKGKHPDTKLLVVGHSPTEEVKRLCHSVEDIELHSDVPDVKEFYKRCRIVMVPLLAGGGTRIKILEAALAGRPVLSTPVGAEGLDLISGKNIMMFQNAEEFSFRFEEMLDTQKYKALVSNAKEFVQKNYSTDKFDEAMKTVISFREERKK